MQIIEYCQEIFKAENKKNKRGDANKWLEYFVGSNKWYIKATTDKVIITCIFNYSYFLIDYNNILKGAC